VNSACVTRSGLGITQGPRRKVDEVTGWGDDWGEDAEGATKKRLLGSPGEGRMGRLGPKQQSRGTLQYTHRKGHNGEGHAVQTGLGPRQRFS